MEQLNNRSLYSKPESRALLGTKQIMFDVSHAINPIETSNHWFFGFAQRVFDNTFGDIVIMEIKVLYSFQQCLFLLCIF
jgi:Na+-translocating ferredoxin:NAD+ oxidoreductase RnfD subunit